MTEIEVKCNYSKLEFKFKKKSIDITPTKNLHLPVGITKAFDSKMAEKASDLSDGPIVVKMKSQTEYCLPQTLRIPFVNGKIHMNVTNTGQGGLCIYRGQNIGVVDFKSACYCHNTRNSIQRCLHDRYIFLNEKESQDYLSLMHETNERAPQKNTRLDIRKTSIYETAKSPRESKYSKVDAKKDPYPSLDAKDQGKHKTDKEILESTIDLSEACITDRQKQAL